MSQFRAVLKKEMVKIFKMMSVSDLTFGGNTSVRDHQSVAPDS
jgi:hypothetical protein